MTTYPIIDRLPLNSCAKLSREAMAVLTGHRAWYEKYYPTMKGRMFTPYCVAIRGRQYPALTDLEIRAATDELTSLGYIESRFYGPNCYGHTDQILTVD